MSEVIQSVLSLIVTLGILVTIHEYGHFWVARRCGVKVLKFSVGFGRALYTWTDKHGTEFSIASIPLGGYVRMLDEREGDVDEKELSQAFNRKPVSQRIAIASAGPIANFLFAIFAYWVMFLSGFNVLIPAVGQVDPGSIAAEANLEVGQEIVLVDGRETPSWRSVNMALVNRIGESGEIEITTQYSSNSVQKTHRLEIQDWLVGAEQTDLIRSLGIHPERPEIPATVGQVMVGGPAERAGFEMNDKIIRLDGVSVKDWFDVVEKIKASEGKTLEFEVERDVNGEVVVASFNVMPERVEDDDGEVVWRVGIGVAPFSYPDSMIRTVRHGIFEAIPSAVDQTWADTKMTLGAIKKMVMGLVSLDNLSGPITIAQVASQSISTGLEAFLSFLALLSVSLAVLNLLPIPVLDGGHILYYSVEALIGKPIPEKWQVLGLKIGVSFILLLMTVAFYNDLMRL